MRYHCPECWKMNWKRILKGNLGLNYFWWQKWNTHRIERYWSGRLIYIQFSKIALIIDCRINWLEDMITGTPR